MRSITKTAAANGFAPRPDFLAETLAMLTEDGSKGTASMLRDIRRNLPTEHDHILGDMLARARAAIEQGLRLLVKG